MDLVIFGTGGFAREVIWAAREDKRCLVPEIDFSQIYFVDDNPQTHNTVVCGYK
jgi:hypothetical protein